MAKKRANGEGNIRKRADGRWEGRYTAGYHPETGKRIIKNVLGKTQAECKAKLKKAIEESQALDVGRADEYTVAAWLRTWFELYAKPHIRPSTMNYYHRNIEQHIIPAIGNIPLNKLTTRDLQKLYNDLQSNGRLRKVQKKEKPGLSNSTVRGIHMMLHNALDRAVKEKLILSNPTENCIIPKIEKQEMKILHPDHISAYLNAAERRNALPMFYLELVSGLRKGELVALQWSDLDEANCTISVSKQASWDTEGNLILSQPKTGNSIREVSIPQDAVELLKQEHAKHPDNPWMFPSSRTGEMYHPDSVVNLHKKILKDVGLEHIRFHDLRHTFATLGTPKRCGCENRQQHAGSLRCWLHPSYLHPCYAADAAKGRRENGQLHGASDVSRKKTQKYRRESKSFLSDALSPFPRISKVLPKSRTFSFDP